jgi:hypothetical protein
MITEFKITNESGNTITIQSFDSFVLVGNAVDVDMFSDANGGFSVEDVKNNAEIETLLQNGTISAKDQYDGIIRTVVPLFGDLYTEISPPTITATVDDYYPVGWENAKLICLDLQGIKNCTGFKATFHGDRKIIRNDSAYEFKIKSNNSSSQSENRVFASEFRTNSGDFRLKKYSIIEILYHGGEQKWYTIAPKKP